MKLPESDSASRLAIWIFTFCYFVRSKTKLGKKKRRVVAKKEFKNAIHSAPEGSVSIDCGANVGSICEIFLRNGLKVHAFEPDPIASKRLIERCGNNPNLQFHAAAVGTAPGKQALFRRKEFEENPEYWTISSSLYKRKVCDDGNFVIIEVLDFIDYLRNIPGTIAVLKMDVEGAEVEILEKLIESGLHKKTDFIFVETHERISLDFALRTARIRATIKVNGLSNFNLDHN